MAKNTIFSANPTCDVSTGIWKKSVKKQASDAIKNSLHEFTCPNCNRKLQVHVGANTCPYCGQRIDLKFDA